MRQYSLVFLGLWSFTASKHATVCYKIAGAFKHSFDRFDPFKCSLKHAFVNGCLVVSTTNILVSATPGFDTFSETCQASKYFYTDDPETFSSYQAHLLFPPDESYLIYATMSA